MNEFINVKPLCACIQRVLPQVYDDTLSYQELLYKVISKLNELIENNNKLPGYIADLIREYISSGEIEKVLAEVLANYMLNVKFPPAGLTPATGDGSADDTEAIQGCIDYAFNHGGMAIYFPSGSYLTQPLVMKNKCTMFGYDRYNTRLVLKGGANTAMLTGNVDELTLTGMGFDGNMDIQVNNVNLFDVTVGGAIITNVLLTDGYDLLKVVVNRDLQLDDVIFNHAVENGLVVSGDGYVQADNIIFKSVSALIGKNYVVLGCNDSILTKVKCEGASPNGVRITGNNNVVKMWNEGGTTAYVDEGQNNSVEVYTVSNVHKFSGSVERHVSGTITDTAGSNVSETVGGKKTVQTVNGYEEIIGAGKTVNVTGNFDEVVSGDKGETAMNINDTSVAGRTETTGTNKTVIVKGNDSEDIAGTKTENIGSNKQETVGGTKVETITGKSTENANGGKVVKTTQYEENMVAKNISGGSIRETLTGDKNVSVANSTENVSSDKTVIAGDIAETSENRTIHTNQDLDEEVGGNKTVNVTGNIVTNAKNYDMNPTNPMKYKNPTSLGSVFNTVPMLDRNNNTFNVLVDNGTTEVQMEKTVKGEVDFRGIESVLGKTIYNKLKDGAKVCCFGDSLVAGIGWNNGSNQTQQNDGMAAILRQIFPNSTITNLAITAKTFHDLSDNSIIAQLNQIPSDVEIIFFDGGINDVKEQCRTYNSAGTNVIGLPSLTDFSGNYDTNTAFGGMNYILNWLKTNRPNADVTYILYATMFQDLAGRYDLFKYCADMYTCIAKKWGVRVFQFGKHITPYLANKSYYADWVHYNQKGYTHLAYEFVKFLLTDRNENDVKFEFICTWADLTWQYRDDAFVGAYLDIHNELRSIMDGWDYSGTFIASSIKVARNVLCTCDHYRLGSTIMEFATNNVNSKTVYYNGSYQKTYMSSVNYIRGYTSLRQITYAGVFYIPIDEVANYTDMPEVMKDNGVVIVENFPMERGLGIMRLTSFYGHMSLGEVRYSTTGYTETWNNTRLMS